MALQPLTGYLNYPSASAVPLSNNSSINVTIDAANEKAAFIFRAPKTGNIRKVGFRTGTVTTGATVSVRLETVDLASGYPSGSLAGTNTSASQVIANSDDNIWFTVTLTADAAVTVGTAYAIVISNPAVSFGNLLIAAGSGTTNLSQFPYAANYDSAWAGKLNTSYLYFYIEYDDGSTANCGNLPVVTAINAVTFTNTSTPDERAMYFRLPFTCRIAGFDVAARNYADNVDFLLYDSDGSSVLWSLNWDKDLVPANAASSFLRVLFGTEITLAANTYYRLAVRPVGSAAVYEMTFPHSNAMGAVNGGSDISESVRADGGAWTNDSGYELNRLVMSLLISAIDDGAGGAGVYTRKPRLIGA